MFEPAVPAAAAATPSDTVPALDSPSRRLDRQPAHAELAEARTNPSACFDKLGMSGLGSGPNNGPSRPGSGKAAARPGGKASRKIRRAAPKVAPRPASELPEPGPNRLFAEAVLPPSAVIDRARVTVNLAESPLGWLVRRGMVTPRQFEAGERLRADFTRAQLSPRTTMAWDAGPAHRGARGAPEGMDATTAQLAAKRRFAAAVTAVGGGLSDVLWRVVCNGEGLETAERALGWPARAGKVVLLLALDRLGDFYELR